jgi:hypothetical protein
MNDDNGDAMLQYMIDEKLIQTRINRNSKEQEFALTEAGWGVMKMLKFFNGEEDENDDEKSEHELTR